MKFKTLLQKLVDKVGYKVCKICGTHVVNTVPRALKTHFLVRHKYKHKVIKK